MSQLQFKKVGVLPNTLEPNTLYFVPSDDPGLLDIYLSDKDGTSTKHTIKAPDILSKAVVFSDEPPELPTESPLWWDTGSGAMYIQYDDGDSVNWVEAMPSIAVPDFAGTGSANTMARSDHYHDGVPMIAAEW